MRSLSLNVERTAKTVLLYGPVGVGKTTSLATAPQPIQIICPEPRDPRQVLQNAIRAGIDLDLVVPEQGTLVEVYRYALETEQQAIAGTYRFKTLCLDGASFLHNILQRNLEDSINDENKAKASQVKDEIERILATPQLHDIGNIGYAGWNVMGTLMTRFMACLNRISYQGVNIIVTAWIGENPRKGASEQEVPMFFGKYFHERFPGMFDFIGRMFPGIRNENYPTGYPPFVSFKLLTPDQAVAILGQTYFPQYMCKAANPNMIEKELQRLDSWTRIFDLADGKE